MTTNTPTNDATPRVRARARSNGNPGVDQSRPRRQDRRALVRDEPAAVHTNAQRMGDQAQVQPSGGLPKETFIRTLRRAAIAPETIEVLQRELPDQVDLDRDGNLLFAYGITIERLVDRLGGSP